MRTPENQSQVETQPSEAIPTLISHMSRTNDPAYIEFVARLRAARKKAQLSQQRFGKLIGEDQTFVSKVETCERRLDVIEAARWCAALGIRLEDIIPSQARKVRAQ